ncbi:DKNYY family protein, partial [Capnocytophaga granulosa]
MNRLLLLTLLLVACKQKPVEQLPTTAEKEVVVQDTITVSDIHRTDSLWRSFWEYKRPYVEGYIINQDYVIYQEKDTRKIIKPDMASFARLDVSRLAKDKNGIYYQGDLIKIDITGFRVVGVISHYDKQSDYYWEEPIWRTYKQAFRGTKPIAISDPATFESVTTCYFKDKNYLYYYDQKVEGADVATLQKELADEEFVSDKDNTYYRGKPFIYKGERVQQVSNNIYKTATHVLRYNAEYDKERAEDYFIELPDYFDIPTLRRLNDFYLIDKNHLYYDENSYPLGDEDLRVPIPKENLSKIKLFEVLVTDGNKVYRGKKPLSGYDAVTFGIVPGHYYYQYDKNGIYNWSKKL